MTISQACKIGGCTRNTIAGLITAGHLKATQSNPHARWNITTHGYRIKRIVAEHAPRAGGAKKPHLAEPTAPTPAAPKVGFGLRNALAFAVLEPKKRAALLAMVECFTADELSSLLRDA